MKNLRSGRKSQLILKILQYKDMVTPPTTQRPHWASGERTRDSTAGENKGQREKGKDLLVGFTYKKKSARENHLDALLAQRIAEEEELTEQQKKRKAQGHDVKSAEEVEALKNTKDSLTSLVKEIQTKDPKRLKEDKVRSKSNDEPTKKSGKRRNR
ncbi:hypothetical protein Tco_0277684 [Tanacetum coccineum]